MAAFSRQSRARRRSREPLPGKLRIVVGAVALGLFLVARRFPDAVESLYGRHGYPWIAEAVG